MAEAWEEDPEHIRRCIRCGGHGGWGDTTCPQCGGSGFINRHAAPRPRDERQQLLFGVELRPRRRP